MLLKIDRSCIDADVEAQFVVALRSRSLQEDFFGDASRRGSELIADAGGGALEVSERPRAMRKETSPCTSSRYLLRSCRYCDHSTLASSVPHG